MRGIQVPEREEDFTADPVELFFDLGFVLAFSQLVGFLLEHHTWADIGRAGLLFFLLWMPWSQFTWSANAVSGNGRGVRALFLVGTVVSIPMAASVSTAYEGGGPVFAVSVGLIYGLALGTMVLAARQHPPLRHALAGYGTVSAVAIAVLLVGGFVDGDGRTVVWLVAAAVIVAAMAAAGRGEWIVRSGHFAERHGLIVIIALGEVIVAIGAPVAGTLEEGGGLPGTTVVALAGAGALACLLWWSYFDRLGPGLEHRAEGLASDQERGRYARDVYTVSHLPLVAGVILTAVGLEEIALHPDEAVPLVYRAMLGGGLLLGLGGVALAVWRAFRVPAKERMVGAAVLVLLLAVGADLHGAWLVVLVDLAVLAALVVEHLRIEGRPARAHAESVEGAAEAVEA